MRKAAALFVMLFVLCIPFSGRAANDVNIRERHKDPQLELLLEVFFRHNPALTLLQISPMGSLYGFHPVVADRILSDAFRSGVLKNPDIGWFWVGEQQLHDPATQKNFRSRFNKVGVYYQADFIIYSRESTRRFLENPEVIQALHGVGFKATANAETAIQALQKLLAIDTPKSNAQMYQREVVYGIFSGFPVRDVLQFSHEVFLHGPKSPDRDFGFPRFDGNEGYLDFEKDFYLGGYITFQETPSIETLEKRAQAKRAVHVYERARELGMSHVSIFNRWPALMCSGLFAPN